MSTPRDTSPRHASRHVRPDPGPPEWVEEERRLALTDLWRPGLYLAGALVLVIAMWTVTSTLERAAGALAPGRFRPPAAEEPAAEEPAAEPGP